jgi:hypothetical protein
LTVRVPVDGSHDRSVLTKEFDDVLSLQLWDGLWTRIVLRTCITQGFLERDKVWEPFFITNQNFHSRLTFLNPQGKFLLISIPVHGAPAYLLRFFLHSLSCCQVYC